MALAGADVAPLLTGALSIWRDAYGAEVVPRKAPPKLFRHSLITASVVKASAITLIASANALNPATSFSVSMTRLVLTFGSAMRFGIGLLLYQSAASPPRGWVCCRCCRRRCCHQLRCRTLPPGSGRGLLFLLSTHRILVGRLAFVAPYVHLLSTLSANYRLSAPVVSTHSVDQFMRRSFEDAVSVEPLADSAVGG